MLGNKAVHQAYILLSLVCSTTRPVCCQGKNLYECLYACMFRMYTPLKTHAVTCMLSFVAPERVDFLSRSPRTVERVGRMVCVCATRIISRILPYGLRECNTQYISYSAVRFEWLPYD